MRTPRPARLFLAFSILSLAYFLLSIFLPPVTPTIRQYHLSLTEYHVLTALLALPRIVVWFAAFYGYAMLDDYIAAIRTSSDGEAFSHISQGVRWLAWGLPIVSLISVIASGLAHNSANGYAAAVIITHFANLIISLAAFTFISTGTRHLLEAVHKQIPLTAIRAVMISFIALAITYCYATVRSVQQQTPNSYHMPMWLILLAVVIPYLYAWLMGLLSAYEISLYRKQVRGLLYQRALNLLAGGLGVAIICSIILQYLTATSGYLRRIHFDSNLLVLYIALVFYAAAFLLIAAGANKLKKIEKV